MDRSNVKRALDSHMQCWDMVLLNRSVPTSSHFGLNLSEQMFYSKNVESCWIRLSPEKTIVRTAIMHTKGKEKSESTYYSL